MKRYHLIKLVRNDGLNPQRRFIKFEDTILYIHFWEYTRFY